MDEMMLVERLFSEPKADPGVAAAGRARLLELAKDAEAAPLRSRGRPRGRRLLGAALLPVAAAATTAVVVAGGTPTPEPRPADPSARRVLLAAATKSAAAPATGRYFRFTEETGEAYPAGSKEHPYTVVSRTVDDLWYSTTPGATGFASFQELGVQPATPADAAAWRAAGSPKRIRERCDEGEIIGHRSGERRPDGTFEEVPVRRRCRWLDVRPGPKTTTRRPGGEGMMGQPPSGLDIAKLSDDPATLRRQLLAWTRADGLAGPVEGDSAQLWAAAGSLVTSPDGPVSPKVRAAAYRVLADLPDVRSLGAVTDRKGRRGEALAREGTEGEGVGPGTYRLIIDPQTGSPLGTDYQGGGSGEYSLVLNYGYTDEAPKLTHGPPPRLTR
ncbi:CU044_5270 family protein [Actinomadura sp. WMMA1423]|uniref:CU044_5270 family protein n=1 Tax=Actinomadura sp. WMMA1423 TaxID=2591108 RepID=UPI0011468F8E|nr:CU044_5270 family protein [Actinomadura sp. WMMA1423]